MTNIRSLFLAALSVALAATPGATRVAPPAAPPVACSLSLGEREDQVERWSRLLRGARVRCELPDGFAFQLAATPARLADLADLIASERACCPFFRFALDFPAGNGPVWLSIRGPAPAKQLVSEMWRRPPAKR